MSLGLHSLGQNQPGDQGRFKGGKSTPLTSGDLQEGRGDGHRLWGKPQDCTGSHLQHVRLPIDSHLPQPRTTLNICDTFIFLKHKKRSLSRGSPASRRLHQLHRRRAESRLWGRRRGCLAPKPRLPRPWPPVVEDPELCGMCCLCPLQSRGSRLVGGLISA